MTRTMIIHEGFAGLEYVDGAFTRQLKPGKYKLKRFLDRRVRSIVLVDLRERSITIKGQEILTADKVAIRVSLLVYFRVRDVEAAVHNVASYEERIYEDVQLAARRFLASRALEAILSDRNEISNAVRERMKLTAEAERERERITAEGERERAQIAAEAELVRSRLRRQAETEEAKALAENPKLMRLRELQALAEMAKSGAKFAVGMRAGSLGELFSGDEPRRE
jgi:regulator of protease activity HflC (stomatin/prohibitin superfamily)